MSAARVRSSGRPLACLLAIAGLSLLVGADTTTGSGREAGGAPEPRERPAGAVEADLVSSLVPSPRPQERWLEVRGDPEKERAFLLRARRDYNIPSYVTPSPFELARICVDNATAEVTSIARRDARYAADPERTRRDVDEINRRCHDRYDEQPWEDVRPPAAHGQHH